uniref:Insulin-like domain-containing protein n=1 Tax=Labrus bergylta TaxID=56723 RepID=A0A3Q3FGF1_9LABR
KVRHNWLSVRLSQSVVRCQRGNMLSCMFYDASSCFRAADSSEDPFSSRQDESSEGGSHNFVVEGLLQGTRDLSITPRDNQGDVFSRKARSFITEEILEALRKADRKGRDVVVGLSNACCKWGCSKSEISSLC